MVDDDETSTIVNGTGVLAFFPGPVVGRLGFSPEPGEMIWGFPGLGWPFGVFGLGWPFGDPPIRVWFFFSSAKVTKSHTKVSNL